MAGTADTREADTRVLNAMLAERNRQAAEPTRAFAKKHLLPYYFRMKSEQPAIWSAWDLDAALESRLIGLLQMKPRRTASGVATITVITKPWPCANNCRYCPNDIRMPKSYLHDEPACQRAERNCFDPYLQTASRLSTLMDMGHTTDKIELIVLGGTWSDYPEPYRNWFISRLFRALNDSDAQRRSTMADLRKQYDELGISSDKDELEAQCSEHRSLIEAGEETYAQAFARRYADDAAWKAAAEMQTAAMEDVHAEHIRNETASHRVVGLVMETRPETVSAALLTHMRDLGCTKIQLGVQSLDDDLMAKNGRYRESGSIERAFALSRLFGLKIHAHFMVNLLGSDPEADKAGFRLFVDDPKYRPDEIKLYPCALIGGTELCNDYRSGNWAPYDQETLVDVLCDNVLATPEWTRISRMIRDFSSGDIVVGNKKANLRQLVEARLEESNAPIREIRHREIASEAVDRSTLAMSDIPYETAAALEHFLQWATSDGRIAGFLRLSLPHPEATLRPGEAMIREVHVYGQVAALGTTGTDGTSFAQAQHAGLGKQLIAKACEIAKEAGYERINVISSIGTRDYYRHIGFDDWTDDGLYQQRPL